MIGTPARLAIGVNFKDLVETQTGQKFVAARSAMHDMKMTVTQLLQTQGHSSHRPHESGIHHRAVFQVDDELAITAVDHFLGKFLQVSTVKEAAFALDLDPNGWPVYPDLD